MTYSILVGFVQNQDNYSNFDGLSSTSQLKLQFKWVISHFQSHPFVALPRVVLQLLRPNNMAGFDLWRPARETPGIFLSANSLRFFFLYMGNANRKYGQYPMNMELFEGNYLKLCLHFHCLLSIGEYGGKAQFNSLGLHGSFCASHAKKGVDDHPIERHDILMKLKQKLLFGKQILESSRQFHHIYHHCCTIILLCISLSPHQSAFVLSDFFQRFCFIFPPIFRNKKRGLSENSVPVIPWCLNRTSFLTHRFLVVFHSIPIVCC